MKKDYNTINNVIRLPHKYAAGPTFTKFYNGLKEGKIYATSCPACEKVFVPARSFCPGCLANLDEWIEVSQEGEVVSWAYSNKEFFGMPGKPPVVLALIRLDGTDCDFLHLIGGIDMDDPDAVKASIKRGTRVRATWNDEKKGHMLDIKCFEPVS
ncbi:MAG: Zn-ribbon domain-containing OB-fold protein [Deltaproteobacteria bacterium]|nr:Zn-ribbon domain-containing OB-fold protein [Deltaproteobacteria bacterium]